LHVFGALMPGESPADSVFLALRRVFRDKEKKTDEARQVPRGCGGWQA
jgi:hypothetical protein